MKKNFTTAFFMVIAAISVFGQNDQLTKEQFNTAIGNAASKADKISYRKTTINKFYSKQKLTQTRTLINENLPPAKRRTLFFTEINGEVGDSMEYITIENIQYTRKNKEDWQKVDLSGGKSGGLFSVGKTTETKNLTQYIFAKTTLDNQPADLYFEYEVLLIDNLFYFLETRYWLNSDGLIIKSTGKVSNVVPENITSVETTNYEYNPKNLKIEAPIK